MALTTSGSSEPPRNANADAAAAAVYGNPARPDATREPRMAGISGVAAAHTSSTSGESAIGAPCIGGESHQWTRTAGKQAGATINNQGSGFPGLANEPSRG